MKWEGCKWNVLGIFLIKYFIAKLFHSFRKERILCSSRLRRGEPTRDGLWVRIPYQDKRKAPTTRLLLSLVRPKGFVLRTSTFATRTVAFYVPRVSAFGEPPRDGLWGSNPSCLRMKNRAHQKVHSVFGPPEGIWTPALQNRNLLRYPAAPRTDRPFVL